MINADKFIVLSAFLGTLSGARMQRVTWACAFRISSQQGASLFFGMWWTIALFRFFDCFFYALDSLIVRNLRRDSTGFRRLPIPLLYIPRTKKISPYFQVTWSLAFMNVTPSLCFLLLVQAQLIIRLLKVSILWNCLAVSSLPCSAFLNHIHVSLHNLLCPNPYLLLLINFHPLRLFLISAQWTLLSEQF